MAQLQSLIRRRRVFPETEEFDPRKLVPPVVEDQSMGFTPRRQLMPIDPQFAPPEASPALPALNMPMRPRLVQPLPVDEQPVIPARLVMPENLGGPQGQLASTVIDPERMASTINPIARIQPPIEFSTGRETRVREINPPDPLTRSIDALRDRQTASLYDPDPQTGEIKKPKGWGSRIKAALKSGGLALLRGEGILGAGASAIEGAIDPTLPAQMRRQRQLAVAGQNVQRDMGIEKNLVDFQTDRTMNDWRNAQIPYLKMRPEIEAEKIAARRDYDAWRMKSGDRKADTYENYIKWRMENGDQRLASYQDYLQFQKETTDRRLTEQERHNRESEEIGNAAVGIRAGEVGRRAENEAAEASTVNSTIDQHVTQLKRQQAEAYQVANDPNRAEWERVDARKRAEELMETIRQEELKRKPVPAPRSAAPPPTRSTSPYTGRTMSKASLSQYAKDNSISEAEARTRLQGMGVVVR